MGFTRVPPVGSPLNTLRIANAEQVLQKSLAPASISFFGSGTESLAAALILAASRGRNRVIVPAYGCPHIISAVEYAGLQPQFCDTAANSPFYDLDQLNALADDNTCAIINADFLGIEAQHTEARHIAKRVGAAYVLDACQMRPPKDLDQLPQNEYRVFSFGRGKPVTALTGGMLLSHEGPEALPATLPNNCSRLRYRLRRLLYPRLLKPYVFGVLCRLPFLAVGTTRYQPLDALTDLPDFIRDEASSAILASAANSLDIVALYEEICSWNGHITAVGNAPKTDYLRFPVLISPAVLRSGSINAWVRPELGISNFYGKSMVEFPEFKPYVKDSGSFPNAVDFSRRLLTLPTHPYLPRHFDASICRYFRQMSAVVTIS